MSVKQLAEAAKNILRIDKELNGFELIRNNIINEWRNSPSTDKEGRENCYQMLHILDELNRLLRKTIDDGTIEALGEKND